MLHKISLVLLTSFMLSMFFARFGYPYLLGYIAAGLTLSPFISAASHQVEMIGHLGMVMLLFIVGLEFDLMQFKRHWKRALIVVFLQLILSFIVTFLAGSFLGYEKSYIVLLSFLCTLSSTGVVVKFLEEIHEITTSNGNFIISILIMQDLTFVPMMLILKSFCEPVSVQQFTLIMVGAIGFLVALIAYISKDSNKLYNVFRGNYESMTLASLTVCFCCASLSSFLGLSPLYGSFLGGLTLGSFGNKLEIMQFALPVSSLLVMVFFISVGMQVNLNYILSNIYSLAIWSLILLFVKLSINIAIIKIIQTNRHETLKRCIFKSLVLSQVSEFSFAFISMFAHHRLLTIDQQHFLNSLTVISLTLGSLLPVIYYRWYNRDYESL